ncbi:unnamed protein product [Cunninghamella echinulata]
MAISDLFSSFISTVYANEEVPAPEPVVEASIIEEVVVSEQPKEEDEDKERKEAVAEEQEEQAVEEVEEEVEEEEEEPEILKNKLWKNVQSHALVLKSTWMNVMNVLKMDPVKTVLKNFSILCIVPMNALHQRFSPPPNNLLFYRPNNLTTITTTTIIIIKSFISFRKSI